MYNLKQYLLKYRSDERKVELIFKNGINAFPKIVLLMVLMTLVLATSSMAISRNKIVKRLNNSVELLKEFIEIPESGIPSSLLKNCEALVVIPHVIKGGFIFGGRHGRGIMVHRLPNGRWSNPCFVNIRGGSFGLQIGGQAVDLILVVKNKRGYEAILQDNFQFSGDATATAGPVGRNAEAGTDLMLKASILSYSRSKGLFAGISLKGATLTIDKKANYSFYKQLICYRKILSDPLMPYRPEVKPLIKVLASYSGKKK